MTETQEYELLEAVADVLKEYVPAAMAPIAARLEELDQKFKLLPTAIRGEKGDRGDVGEKGEKGDRGLAGDAGPIGPKGEPGEAAQPGAKGETGEKGEKGEPGLTTIGEAGERGPRGEKGDAGMTGPQGNHGEKGEAGDTGEPGVSIHPDTISLMVVTEVAKAIALIPKAKDGEPGRDAAHLDFLLSIDETRSYPRGTWASHRGGLWMSVRQTDIAKEGNLIESGWAVMVEGSAAPPFVAQDESDPRNFTVTTVQSSGTKAIATFRIPFPIYENIWREGEDYRKGTMVTRDGSVWHCNADHTKVAPSTPNTLDWTLCVKRGQNGRDGTKGEKGEPGQPGKDGKDFRPMGGKR